MVQAEGRCRLVTGSADVSKLSGRLRRWPGSRWRILLHTRHHVLLWIWTPRRYRCDHVPEVYTDDGDPILMCDKCGVELDNSWWEKVPA